MIPTDRLGAKHWSLLGLAALVLALLCASPACAASPSAAAVAKAVREKMAHEKMARIEAAHLRARVTRAGAGLKLEPAELTLSNNRWASGASVLLTLVGPNAKPFAALGPRQTLTLYDASNDEAKLRLEAFKESSRGVFEAKLVLLGNPPVGRYSGEVALFSYSPAAPRVKLTVTSHRSFALAFLLVIAGVLVGGLAQMLYGLNGRRDVLLKAISEADARVVKVRGALGNQAQAVSTAMWLLDGLATDSGQARAASSPLGNLCGVEALRDRIAEASNDKDLEQDTEATLEVVARLQRWLRVAPAAWRLKLVADASAGVGPGWFSTNTWRDTRLLQEHLQYEPRTTADADDLVERILWQIRWHQSLAQLYVWASKSTGAAKTKRTKGVEELEAKLANPPGVLGRKATERDELDFELERLRERLQAPAPAAPPDLPPLQDLAVDWQTTPNLFTGWATIDGTTWLRVRRAAVASNTRSWPGFRRPSWGNLIWLVLPVAAASAIYAATIYNATWGSLTDVATALTAGFVGKVLVDWAKLPIFQSRRLLPTAKAAGAPAAPSSVTPASAASPSAGPPSAGSSSATGAHSPAGPTLPPAGSLPPATPVPSAAPVPSAVPAPVANAAKQPGSD